MFVCLLLFCGVGWVGGHCFDCVVLDGIALVDMDIVLIVVGRI